MIVDLELFLHSRRVGSSSTNCQHSEFLLCGSDSHLGLCVMGKKVNFFHQQGGDMGSQTAKALTQFTDEKATKENKTSQEL